MNWMGLIVTRWISPLGVEVVDWVSSLEFELSWFIVFESDWAGISDDGAVTFADVFVGDAGGVRSIWQNIYCDNVTLNGKNIA